MVKVLLRGLPPDITSSAVSSALAQLLPAAECPAVVYVEAGSVKCVARAPHIAAMRDRSQPRAGERDALELPPLPLLSSLRAG